MNEVKINVLGMNCNHCKINVENSLKKIQGIDYAVADVVNGEVSIKGAAVDLSAVQLAVEELGYAYRGVID
ncbi:MAG: heavy-metal-associated domain-containing protein [Bacteroidales bacterium]|nr:heavy-metal-associated domain-containing protein [Bacteroidales bacterium]